MELNQKSKLSFIEEHEEKDSIAAIEEHLGFEPGRPAGYHMLVKIHVREEELKPMLNEDGSLFLDAHGKPKSIFIPDTSRARDKWTSCVALVVAQGPEAYKGDRFKESGPWCRVGDFIVIPRNEGTQINYRGYPMQIIPDDRCLMVIEDPDYVTRD